VSRVYEESLNTPRMQGE